MKIVLWILAVAAAAAGVYGIVTGAGPLWTLAAGVAVGAFVAAAMRGGKERP